jgi:hypothetical protein
MAFRLAEDLLMRFSRDGTVTLPVIELVFVRTAI